MIPADIPKHAGAGFRTCHARDVLEGKPDIAWFEIHPENYMVDGGPRLKTLEKLRADYPVSFHGLALSLASFERPDKDHLKALKGLVDRCEPGLVSEHIAWSALDGRYFADLLPAPFTKESLACLVRNVCEVQEYLGRAILIENPAQYLALPQCEMSELDFVTETARRAGCGILLDVNNLFVTQQNLGQDAAAYIEDFDVSLIGEVHLAGYGVDHFRGKDILIDSHSDKVSDEVWALFEMLVSRTGPLPALLEWDNDIPGWDVLEDEVRKAGAILAAKRQAA